MGAQPSLLNGPLAISTLSLESDELRSEVARLLAAERRLLHCVTDSDNSRDSGSSPRTSSTDELLIGINHGQRRRFLEAGSRFGDAFGSTNRLRSNGLGCPTGLGVAEQIELLVLSSALGGTPARNLSSRASMHSKSLIPSLRLPTVAAELLREASELAALRPTPDHRYRAALALSLHGRLAAHRQASLAPKSRDGGGYCDEVRRLLWARGVAQPGALAAAAEVIAQTSVALAASQDSPSSPGSNSKAGHEGAQFTTGSGALPLSVALGVRLFFRLLQSLQRSGHIHGLLRIAEQLPQLLAPLPPAALAAPYAPSALILRVPSLSKENVATGLKRPALVLEAPANGNSNRRSNEEGNRENDRAVVDSLWAAVEELCALDESVLGAEQHSSTLAALLALAVKRAQLPPLLRAAQLLLFGAPSTAAASATTTTARETGDVSIASQALRRFGANDKSNSGNRNGGIPSSEVGGEGSSSSGGGGGGSLHGSSLNVRRYATKKLSPEVSAYANRIALAGGRTFGASNARRTGGPTSATVSTAPIGAPIPQPSTSLSTPGMTTSKIEAEELGWSPTGSLTSSRAGSAERAGDWSGERADLSSAGSVDYLEDSFGDEVTLLGGGVGDFKQDEDEGEDVVRSRANLSGMRSVAGDTGDDDDEDEATDDDSENDELPFFGLSMGDVWDNHGHNSAKQNHNTSGSSDEAMGEGTLPKHLLKAVGPALQELSNMASTVPTLPWLDWADLAHAPSHSLASEAWAPWVEPAVHGQPGQAQSGSGFLMTFGKGDHGKLGHGWGQIPSATTTSSSKAAAAAGAAPEQSAPPSNMDAPAAVRALAGVPLARIATLSTHSACVTASGALLTWGNGDKHRLGHDGLAAPEALPRLVRGLRNGLPPVHDLACGLGHTIALLVDGSVYTWGHGGNGRLGHGDLRDRTVPTRLTALHPQNRDDSRIKNSRNNQESAVDGVENEEAFCDASVAAAADAMRIVAVFSGASHSVAVDKQGCAWSWGKNNQGQCGVNSSDDVLLPTFVSFMTPQVASTNLNSISSGFDGDDIISGGEDIGKDGVDNDVSATLPLATEHVGGMASIATPARSRYGVAIVATPNEHRGLGAAASTSSEVSTASGDTSDEATAPSAAAAAAAAAAANASSPSGFAARRRSLVAAGSVTPGTHRQAATHASGEEEGDGESDESAFDRLLASPTTRSPGSSYLRQSMGLPSSSPSATTDAGFARGAAGAASSTEVSSRSDIANDNEANDGFGTDPGQQQVNDASDNAARVASLGSETDKAEKMEHAAASSAPATEAMKSEVVVVVSAAGGWDHTLFLLADGSVWSCGGGYKDLPPVLGLGAARSGSALVPTRVPVLGSFTLTSNPDVGDSAGGADGAGASSNSHLGVPRELSQSPSGNQGMPSNPRRPRRFNGDSMVHPPEDDLRCVAVACGWDHSLAVTRGGQLFTWGAGQYGKLGHGDEEPRDVPTLVATLARGANSSGSIGGSSGGISSSGGGVRVMLAAAGCEHSACVDADGGLWTWGHDDAGRLGHGMHPRCDGSSSDLSDPDSALRPPLATKNTSTATTAAVVATAAAAAAVPTSSLSAGSDEARLAPSDAAARAAVTMPRRVASLTEQGLRVVALAVGDKYNMLLVRPRADEVDGEHALAAGTPTAAPTAAAPAAPTAVANGIITSAADAAPLLSSSNLCTGAWLRAQAPLQLATSQVPMRRQQAALVLLAQLERVASKQLLSSPNLTPAHLRSVAEKAAATAVAGAAPSEKGLDKGFGADSSALANSTRLLPLPLPPSWPLVLNVGSETFDLLLVLLRCALSEPLDSAEQTASAAAAAVATAGKTTAGTPLATATNNPSANNNSNSTVSGSGSGLTGRVHRNGVQAASPARSSGASPARRVQSAMRLSPSKAAASTSSTTAHVGTSPGGVGVTTSTFRQSRASPSSSSSSSSTPGHANRVERSSKFEGSLLVNLAANSLSALASWDGSTLANPAAGSPPETTLGGADSTASPSVPARRHEDYLKEVLPATAANLNPQFVAWASLFTGLRLLRANTRHLVLLADATATAAEQVAESNIRSSNNSKSYSSDNGAKNNAKIDTEETAHDNASEGTVTSTSAEAHPPSEHISKRSNPSQDGGSAAAEVPLTATTTGESGVTGADDGADEAAVQEAIIASLQAPPRPKRLPYPSSSSSGGGSGGAQSTQPSDPQNDGASPLDGRAKQPARPLNAVLADLHALLHALLRSHPPNFAVQPPSTAAAASSVPSTPAVSPQSSLSTGNGSIGGLADRSGAKNPRSRSKSANTRSSSPSSSSSSLPTNTPNAERGRGNGGGGNSRGANERSVSLTQQQRSGPLHAVGLAAVAALQKEAILCISEAFPLLYPSPDVRAQLLRKLVAHLAPDPPAKLAKSDTASATGAAPVASSSTGNSPANSRPGSRTSTASSRSSSREGGTRPSRLGGAAASVPAPEMIFDVPLNCPALVSALTVEVLREDRFAPMIAPACASALETSASTRIAAGGGAAAAAPIGEGLSVPDIERMLANLTMRCQADLKVEINTLRESLSENASSAPKAPSPSSAVNGGSMGKGNAAAPSAAAAAAAATAMTMLPLLAHSASSERVSAMPSECGGQPPNHSPSKDALAVLVALQTHSLSVWASAGADTSASYSIQQSEEVALAQIERVLNASRRTVDEVLSLLTKQQQAQQKQEQPPQQLQPAENTPLRNSGVQSPSLQVDKDSAGPYASHRQQLCTHVTVLLKRHLWRGPLGALVSSLLAFTINSDEVPCEDSKSPAASSVDAENIHTGSKNARRFAVSAAAARALPLLLPLLRNLDLVTTAMYALCVSPQQRPRTSATNQSAFSAASVTASTTSVTSPAALSADSAVPEWLLELQASLAATAARLTVAALVHGPSPSSEEELVARANAEESARKTVSSHGSDPILADKGTDLGSNSGNESGKESVVSSIDVSLLPPEWRSLVAALEWQQRGVYLGGSGSTASVSKGGDGTEAVRGLRSANAADPSLIAETLSRARRVVAVQSAYRAELRRVGLEVLRHLLLAGSSGGSNDTVKGLLGPTTRVTREVALAFSVLPPAAHPASEPASSSSSSSTSSSTAANCAQNTRRHDACLPGSLPLKHVLSGLHYAPSLSRTNVLRTTGALLGALAHLLRRNTISQPTPLSSPRSTNRVGVKFESISPPMSNSDTASALVNSSDVAILSLHVEVLQACTVLIVPLAASAASSLLGQIPEMDAGVGATALHSDHEPPCFSRDEALLVFEAAATSGLAPLLSGLLANPQTSPMHVATQSTSGSSSSSPSINESHHSAQPPPDVLVASALLETAVPPLGTKSPLNTSPSSSSSFWQVRLGAWEASAAEARAARAAALVPLQSWHASLRRRFGLPSGRHGRSGCADGATALGIDLRELGVDLAAEPSPSWYPSRPSNGLARNANADSTASSSTSTDLLLPHFKPAAAALELDCLRLAAHAGASHLLFLLVTHATAASTALAAASYTNSSEDFIAQDLDKAKEMDKAAADSESNIVDPAAAVPALGDKDAHRTPALAKHEFSIKLEEQLAHLNDACFSALYKELCRCKDKLLALQQRRRDRRLNLTRMAGVVLRAKPAVLPPLRLPPPPLPHVSTSSTAQMVAEKITSSGLPHVEATACGEGAEGVHGFGASFFVWIAPPTPPSSGTEPAADVSSGTSSPPSLNGNHESSLLLRPAVTVLASRPTAHSAPSSERLLKKKVTSVMRKSQADNNPQTSYNGEEKDDEVSLWASPHAGCQPCVRLVAGSAHGATHVEVSILALAGHHGGADDGSEAATNTGTGSANNTGEDNGDLELFSPKAGAYRRRSANNNNQESSDEEQESATSTHHHDAGRSSSHGGGNARSNISSSGESLRLRAVLALQKLTTSRSLPTGRWVQVCCSLDTHTAGGTNGGSAPIGGTLRIFVDGELDNEMLIAAPTPPGRGHLWLAPRDEPKNSDRGKHNTDLKDDGGIASETSNNGNNNNKFATAQEVSPSYSWPPVVSDVTWYAAPVSATSARMMASTNIENSDSTVSSSLVVPSSVERSCQQAAEHYCLLLVAGLCNLSNAHLQTSSTSSPTKPGDSRSSDNSNTNRSNQGTVLERLCSTDWLQLMIALLPVSGTAPQALLFRLLTAVLTFQPLPLNFAFKEASPVLSTPSSSSLSTIQPDEFSTRSDTVAAAQGALLRSLFKLLASASFKPSSDGLNAAERRALAARNQKKYEFTNYNHANKMAASTPTRDRGGLREKWSTTPGSLSDDGDDDEGILPTSGTASRSRSSDELDDGDLNARGLGVDMLQHGQDGYEFDDNDEDDERYYTSGVHASSRFDNKEPNTTPRRTSGRGQDASFATLPPFALGSTAVHQVMDDSTSHGGPLTTVGGAAARVLFGDHATQSSETYDGRNCNDASTVRGVVCLLQALLFNSNWQAATTAALTHGLERGVPRHLVTVTPSDDLSLIRRRTQSPSMAEDSQALSISTAPDQNPPSAEASPRDGVNSSDQSQAGTSIASWRGTNVDPRVALFAAHSNLPAGLAALELLGSAQGQSWCTGDTALIAAGTCFDAPLSRDAMQPDSETEHRSSPKVQQVSQSAIVSVAQVLPAWPPLGAAGSNKEVARGAVLVLLSATSVHSLAPIVEAPALQGQQDLLFSDKEAPEINTLVSVDPLPALRGVLFAPHVAGDLVARTGGLLALVPLPLLQPVPQQLVATPRQILLQSTRVQRRDLFQTVSFAHRALPPALAFFLTQGLGHELATSRMLHFLMLEANRSPGPPSISNNNISSNSRARSRSTDVSRVSAKLADEQLEYDAILLNCRARALTLRATSEVLATSADAFSCTSANAELSTVETAASTFLEADLLPSLLPLAGTSLDALPPVALGVDAWQVAKHLPAVGRLAAWLAQGVDTTTSGSHGGGTAGASGGLAALEQCAAVAWRRLTALPPDSFARSPWCQDHARSLPALADSLQRRAASSANRRSRLALRRVLLSKTETGSDDTRNENGHDTDDDLAADNDVGSDSRDALEPPPCRVGFTGAARQRVLAELDPRSNHDHHLTPEISARNQHSSSSSSSSVDGAVAAWFPVGWSARAPLALLPPSGFSLPPYSCVAADPLLAVAATSLAAAEAAAAKQRLEVFRSPSSIDRSASRGSGALEGQAPTPEEQLAAVDGWRMRALSAFPTVRLSGCALAIGEGQWYYEAVLLTDGLMQIGWAADQAPPDVPSSAGSSSNGGSMTSQGMQTAFGGVAGSGAAASMMTSTVAGAVSTESGSFACDPLDGTGCGDHTKSWAFDGLRQRRWSVASSPYGERWRMGDVLG